MARWYGFSLAKEDKKQTKISQYSWENIVGNLSEKSSQQQGMKTLYC